MKTITIQIGNSDGKLRQVEWADFVEGLDSIIRNYATVIHFFGGSSNWLVWQNVCWVIEIAEKHEFFESFLLQVERCRKHYRQESVAWTEGKTRFV
jgi:hypothetical protein